jgi:hypothetical protein
MDRSGSPPWLHSDLRHVFSNHRPGAPANRKSPWSRDLVIAVVIECLDPARGGAEVYTADFIRAGSAIPAFATMERAA